jgi:hypothetical protein
MAEPIEYWNELVHAFKEKGDLVDSDKSRASDLMEKSPIALQLRDLMMDSLYDITKFEYLYLTKDAVAIAIKDNKIYYFTSEPNKMTYNSQRHDGRQDQFLITSFNSNDLLYLNVYYEKYNDKELGALNNLSLSNAEVTFNLRKSDAIFESNFRGLTRKLLEITG